MQCFFPILEAVFLQLKGGISERVAILRPKLTATRVRARIYHTLDEEV